MNNDNIPDQDTIHQQAMERCAKCSGNSTCAKYQDLLFLKAHEDEANKVVLDAARLLAGMITTLVTRSPILMLADQETLCGFAQALFTSGYIRGRKFPTVPEVFTRECPDDPHISS